MPGTIIFKPAQANLVKDNDFFTKMDTYCDFKLGNQDVKTSVCKSGGQQPHWNDTVIIKRAYEPTGVINIMGKEWSNKDSVIGSVDIDLQEIESKGRVSKWYKISYDNQPAGELFMESMFIPDSSGTYKQTPYQQSYAQPTNPYEDFGCGLYPPNIYSPAKLEFHDQRVASQVPGHDYTHQITYPHVSHYLTPEEINKLHSRQEERYFPKRKVVGTQPAPPSWPGYETVAVQRSPEKQEQQELHSIESTAGGTPETQRGVPEVTQKEAPEIMSYYPMLGGISYVPSKHGMSYEPFYGEEGKIEVKEKGKEKSLREKFDEVANEKGSLLGQVQSLETNAI